MCSIPDLYLWVVPRVGPRDAFFFFYFPPQFEYNFNISIQQSDNTMQYTQQSC